MDRIITDLKQVDRSMTYIVKQLRVDPLIKLKKYTGATTQIGPSMNGRGNPVTGLVEPHTTLDGVKVEGTRPQMEEILGMSPGTLKENSPFWGTYLVRIGAEDKRLDLSEKEDLLAYLFLRAQTRVALTLKNAGTKAAHEFVMYSPEEEDKLKAARGNFRRKAYALADELDLETKAEILSIYGQIVHTSKVNTIEAKINEQIDSDAKKFLAITDDPTLRHKALIRKALHAGVLHLEDGAVKHGEVEVGMTIPLAAIAVSKNKPLETVLRAKLTGDMEVIKKALAEAGGSKKK